MKPGKSVNPKTNRPIHLITDFGVTTTLCGLPFPQAPAVRVLWYFADPLTLLDRRITVIEYVYCEVCLKDPRIPLILLGSTDL